MTTPTVTGLTPDADARLAARLEPYLDLLVERAAMWAVWCAAQGLLATAEGVTEYNIGPIVGDSLGDLTETLPRLEARGLVQRHEGGWYATPDGALLYHWMDRDLAAVEAEHGDAR